MFRFHRISWNHKETRTCYRKDVYPLPYRYLQIQKLITSLYHWYLHFAEHTEQAEQTEQLNYLSYLVMLLWRQLFSATIGSHMRP